MREFTNLDSENDAMAILNDIKVASPTGADRMRLFQGLSPDDRDFVARFKTYDTFTEGRTILREGQFDQSLWVILKGRCVVVKTLPNACEQQFAMLNGGDLFGELSFVESAPHSMSIRAIEKVEVMRIRRTDFDRLAQSDPFVAYKLLSNAASETAARVRRMNRYTLDLFERSGAAARILAQTTSERDLLKSQMERAESELVRLKSLLKSRESNAKSPTHSVRPWLRLALLGVFGSSLFCLLAAALLVNEQATGWFGMLFEWLERIRRIWPQLI